MALMFYDFCNFVYLEFKDYWGNVFQYDVYAYSVGEEMVTVFRRSRSCSDIKQITRKVLDGEEEIVWRQPKFELGEPEGIDNMEGTANTVNSESESLESWDDFIQVL